MEKTIWILGCVLLAMIIISTACFMGLALTIGMNGILGLKTASIVVAIAGVSLVSAVIFNIVVKK